MMPARTSPVPAIASHGVAVGNWIRTESLATCLYSDGSGCEGRRYRFMACWVMHD